jgi:short-subunit dehydrogenase
MSGVRLAHQYLPRMLARNCGRLIFITSDAGIQTPPEMIHYGMTVRRPNSLKDVLWTLATAGDARF